MEDISAFERRQGRQAEPTGENSGYRSRRSHLELLPAELLQQLFLDSCNGNLLLAAPVVAMKVSGNQMVYRASFLLAFYNHQFDEVASLIGFGSLAPSIDFPLRAWEVRSLTKAILRSRWCTCRWATDFVSSLYQLVLTDSLKFVRSGGTYHFESHEQSVYSLELYEDKMLKKLVTQHDGTVLLPFSAEHFDIRLQMYYEPPVHDENSDEPLPIQETLYWYWPVDPFDQDALESEFRHVQWRFCGSVTMSPFNPNGYPAATPFRDMVSDLLTSKSFHETDRYDFATLEDRLLPAVWFANDVKFGECRLLEMLAIDFYFYAEDETYKISPALYRAAAIADLLHRLRPDESEDYIWRRIHLLFDIDPYSLPVSDHYIKAWAKGAVQRLPGNLGGLISHAQGNSLLDDAGIWAAHSRRLHLNLKYEVMMGHQILRRINLGILEPSNIDRGPNFNCFHITPLIPQVDSTFYTSVEYEEQVMNEGTRGEDESSQNEPESSPMEAVTAECDGYILHRGIVPGFELEPLFEDENTADSEELEDEEVTDGLASEDRGSAADPQRWEDEEEAEGQVFVDEATTKSDAFEDETALEDPVWEDANASDADEWEDEDANRDDIWEDEGGSEIDDQVSEDESEPEDVMDCIDWAVTPGRHDEYSSKMLQDDNLPPHENFDWPWWWEPVVRPKFLRGIPLPESPVWGEEVA